jgi:hypothetical protein
MKAAWKRTGCIAPNELIERRKTSIDEEASPTRDDDLGGYGCRYRAGSAPVPRTRQ